MEQKTLPREATSKALPDAPQDLSAALVDDLKLNLVPEIDDAAWLAAAKKTLLKEGVAAVKVERLAKVLNVSRGGFYWRFKNRAELLDALLVDWRESNSRAMLAALNGPGSPPARFKALMEVWINEKEYSPRYDTALREWARVSSKVAKAVHEVDEERIAAFQRLFEDAGYEPNEALVRARITYYHQIGYYTLGVKEDRKRRYELGALYMKVLTGF